MAYRDDRATKSWVYGAFSKFIVSVFLVYHVCCIVLMPNGLSFLGRQFNFLFTDYARLVGVATNWALFAPDPADPFYLTYEVYKESDLIKQGYLPESGPNIDINPGKRRMLYYVRQLLVDPSMIEKIMSPWLCRKYPEATHVQVRTTIAKMPLLDIVLASQELPPGPVRQTNPMVIVYCDGEPGYFFE